MADHRIPHRQPSRASLTPREEANLAPRDDSASPSSVSWSEVGQALARRKGLLLRCVGICLALAATYFAFATRRYESSVQLLVIQKDAKLAARGADGSEDSSPNVTDDLLATHMQIVSSRQIVKQALERHGYDKLPSIARHLAAGQDATDFVIDHMYVTRGGLGQAKGGHVLSVTFRHTSAEECQNILNAIVESYKGFLAEKFHNVGKEATDLIARAKVDLAAEMAAAEEKLHRFRQQAPLLWKGEESANIHRVRYDELEAALSDLRLKAGEARARLDVVTAAAAEQDRRNAPDIERLSLLDERNIQRLGLLVSVDQGGGTTPEFLAAQPMRAEGARAEHETLLSLLLKERTLGADLGPDHPQLMEVKRQIAAFHDFLKAKADAGHAIEKPQLNPRHLVGAYISLLEHDAKTLEMRTVELERLADEERNAAKALIVYELRGEALRKEVARKQELYETVLARLREVDLMKDYGGFVAEVIAPVEPGQLVAPKLLLSLLVGGLVGLVCGCVAVGVAELNDPRFASPQHIARTLDLPLLSQFPLVPCRPREAGDCSGAFLAPTVEAFQRRTSRASDLIRGLRTALMFQVSDAKHKVLQVTGASRGDGKSTVAANLAVSLTQVGCRVLLVDCDLRNSSLAATFGIDSEPGLADVLLGHREPISAICETGVERLSLLPCGTLCENPTELLCSAGFAELLERVRTRFDFILLDAPPLLETADSRVIAHAVDAVLLVVGLSADSREQVAQAVDLLDEAQAHVVGVVVNSYRQARKGALRAFGRPFHGKRGPQAHRARHGILADFVHCPEPVGT